MYYKKPKSCKNHFDFKLHGDPVKMSKYRIMFSKGC